MFGMPIHMKYYANTLVDCSIFRKGIMKGHFVSKQEDLYLDSPNQTLIKNDILHTMTPTEMKIISLFYLGKELYSRVQ